ncbi:hypothetical protein L208DRAFT_1410695, partial [Tricholoma matsutake]
EQSGAVDVDMREGSMNEHDKAPNDATPESSPCKMPSPSNDSLSTEKDSPITGEKRKNLDTRGKNKENRQIAPSTAKNKSVDAVERNYFEEIKFGGVSRLVDIINLMQDMVSHLPS